MSLEPEKVPDLWCGICSSYGNHDTEHHGAAGRGETFAVGDAVTHPKCEDFSCLVPVNLHDVQGRIEGHRAPGYVVAFPNHGRTFTVLLAESKLVRYKPKQEA